MQWLTSDVSAAQKPDPIPTPERTLPAARARSERIAVVLVILDGVRWQEIFLGADAELAKKYDHSTKSVVGAGEVAPNLYALAQGEGAALGAPGSASIEASGPNYVSLPGYIELLSGRPSRDCQTNGCEPPKGRTLVGEVRDRTTPSDVAVFSSWSGVFLAVLDPHADIVMSVGKNLVNHKELLRSDAEISHALTEGARTLAPPALGDFRADRFTARIALRYLELKRPRLMVVALGEPDEWAHAGYYGHYLSSIKECDDFIGRARQQLATLEAQGWDTALFVTTDHGRSQGFRDHGKKAPESGRVFLIAGGSLIKARGALPLPSPARRLCDVAPTLRHALSLPRDDDSQAGSAIDELIDHG